MSKITFTEQSKWYEAMEHFVATGHEFNAKELNNGVFEIEFTGAF